MRPARRRLLAATAAWGLAPRAGAAAAETGSVVPRLAPPALALHDEDGGRFVLDARLRGKATAVQLMFTGCSTTCPPQGALFAAVAGAGLHANAQLLSISIDALGDTPAALARWLGLFGRPAGWHAAVPAPKDADPLADWLKGAPGRSGTHTAQVFLFDRAGRLCYRTGDMPPARDIAAGLDALARGA